MSDSVSEDFDYSMFDSVIVSSTKKGTAKTIIKDIYKLAKNESNEDIKKQYQLLIANLMTHYDFNGLGGAVLLGFDKVIIKGHGASDSYSIKNIIEQATKVVQGNIIEKMEQNLQ